MTRLRASVSFGRFRPYNSIDRSTRVRPEPMQVMLGNIRASAFRKRGRMRRGGTGERRHILNLVAEMVRETKFWSYRAQR
jgi:hypothetical protein